MAITHALIQELLARRHSSWEWKFFAEFRPLTGWGATVNSIDAVAVGIYKKHAKIVAYEIKVTREDFIADVRQFKKKHQFALMMSHEFYYICPWNVISKAEVPEVAGLYYVNQKNKISQIKHAVYREQDCIPFGIVQGLVSHVGKVIHDAKIPVKYLGRQLTQEDFLALVLEEKGKDWADDVKSEAASQRQEEAKREKGYKIFMRELIEEAGLFYTDKAKALPVLKKYCIVGKELLADSQFHYDMKQLKESFAKVEKILKEYSK